MGDVVVEGEDGADEVEGRVEDVGEVVTEGVVVRVVGAEGDAVAFGVGGWGEIFLLKWISLRRSRGRLGRVCITSMGLPARLSSDQR